MKKLLVVGVIVLFIGLAFAPSINANISKESELVEFTTEACGLNGGKHTVQLTKAEAEEVEKLIDDIEIRLDEVETREEAVEIFNEAIVELDKYGLLGGLSVKQAQRLVAGRYQNSRVVKLLEKLYGENPTTQGDYENRLCLIAGRTSYTGSYGFIWLIPYSIAVWLAVLLTLIMWERGLYYLPWLLFIIITFIGLGGTVSNINPFAIGHAIGVGGAKNDQEAEGWIWTIGMNGAWTINTPIWGQIHIPLPFLEISYSGAEVVGLYPGVIGFIGLMISSPFEHMNAFFLGSSIAVRLSSQPPLS